MPSFEAVLEQSLCSEQTTRAWSEATKSYKPTKVRRAMVSPPNVLCIDTGIESPFAEAASLYRLPRPSAAGGISAAAGGDAANEDEGAAAAKGGHCESSSGGGKTGGVHGGSSGESGWGSVEGERGPLCAEHEWLPLSIRLDFDKTQERFLVSRIDSPEVSGIDSCEHQTSSHMMSEHQRRDASDTTHTSHTSEPSEPVAAGHGGERFEYQLVAVVSCVFGGDDKDWKDKEAQDGRHLITHVRVAHHDLDAKTKSTQQQQQQQQQQQSGMWLLVNDFLLTPVSADEVVRFQASVPQVCHLSSLQLIFVHFCSCLLHPRTNRERKVAS